MAKKFIGFRFARSCAHHIEIGDRHDELEKLKARRRDRQNCLVREAAGCVPTEGTASDPAPNIIQIVNPFGGGWDE